MPGLLRRQLFFVRDYLSRDAIQDALRYDSQCQLLQNIDNILERDFKMLNGVKIL